jgi:hypothetical protein
MKRRIADGLSTLLLLGALVWLLLGTTGCSNGNVYVGVSVAGPYGAYGHGYPYYGGGYRGGVVYGRPYYR